MSIEKDEMTVVTEETAVAENETVIEEDERIVIIEDEDAEETVNVENTQTEEQTTAAAPAAVSPLKKSGNHIKKNAGDWVFDICNITFFVLFAIICIFPFWYLFINTISDNEAVNKGAVNFLPQGINLKNYTQIIQSGELGQAFLVTIARTIIGTVTMVLASAFIGYLVTKNEMWHKKFWYRFLIITMYFNAGLIPGYLNNVMLGLSDSFLVYIIPGIVAPYNIILVKTYIESIPPALEESAFIDGAGYFKIFRKIILPLSVPILATIAIFGMVGQWNSFMDSLIYFSGKPELQTLQHKLDTYLRKSSNLQNIMSGTVTGSDIDKLKESLSSKVRTYTVSMVTILPILIVYPFMTRYFQKGIMLGAVKG